VHFPWSGSVAQQIEPNTSWFFDAIRPSAGDGEIERRAFEIASYGKQLGLITEAVLGLAQRDSVSGEQLAQALQRLETIRGQIEAVKVENTDALVGSISAQLERLRQREPLAFQRLAKAFQP
jgi:ABC-type phosphate transport system auxiliary subunit